MWLSGCPRWKSAEYASESEDEDEAGPKEKKKQKTKNKCKSAKKKKKGGGKSASKPLKPKPKPAPKKKAVPAPADAAPSTSSEKESKKKGEKEYGLYKAGEYSSKRKSWIAAYLKANGDATFRVASDLWNECDERMALLEAMPRSELARRRFI